MKKHSILSVALIFGLTAFAFQSCSENSSHDNGKSKSEIVDTVSGKEPLNSSGTEVENIKQTPSLILKKGDTAKVNGVVFIVKNVIPEFVPDNQYDKSKPNEKFAAVQIWIQNISNSDFDLKDFKGEFKLFDNEDAEYVDGTNNWDFGRRKPILVPDDIRETSLKANQIRSGWLTFTINKTSVPQKVQYKEIVIKL